jgi:hypothetical protein
VGLERDRDPAPARDPAGRRGRTATHGATVVVLSQGMDLRLHVDPATLAYLRERGVQVHILETKQAVKVYNELAKQVPVGGLFHSTC